MRRTLRDAEAAVRRFGTCSLIANGAARADGRQLAAYLQARGDNDQTPELIELTAYDGMSLDFALRAMEAEAIGTRCTLPLYHAQMSASPGEHLTRDQIRDAVNLYEENMGFQGLARCVVLHKKHGQEHVHIVWGRIDPVTGKARDYNMDYKKQERTARELETRFGLRQVQGKWCALDGRYFTPEELKANAQDRRQSRQTNRAEQSQQKRGAAPKAERQATITAIWQATKTGRDLREQLAAAGYTLAKGDRRSYTVVDRAGEAHALARQIHGVTGKEVEARLIDVNPSSIPTVQEVREAMRRTATERSTVTLDRDEQVSAPGAPGREPEAPQRAGEVPQQPSPWIEREDDRSTFTEADAALQALTRQHSTFTASDIERYARHHTKSLPEYEALVEAVLDHADLVELGEDRVGTERFTSRSMLETELRMDAAADDLARNRKHGVSPGVQDAVPGIDKLSPEQQRAYRHVLGREGLSLVEGYAGTGKSHMLGAARKAWVAAGYRVHGTALSGIAAEGLQIGSGIESRTLHSLLGKLESGKLVLDKKDVIVLDEAGMVGSRQMAQLLHHANQAKAKVVLVGDAEQLQAIDAGGAFRALKDRHGAAAIMDVRRQAEQWQRAATTEFATERTAEGLDRYWKHGMVHDAPTRDAAKDDLIRAWTETRKEAPFAAQIILAYTRADVAELNERAREAYRCEGRLTEDHDIITVDRDGERHKTKFAEGDRLYFLQNDTRLGVKNGTLGTVREVAGTRMTVDTDAGKRVVFDTKQYGHVTHGYAATVHRSQGVTVDRTWLLASRYLDRHAAYVGMTRHRERADLFWSREEFRDFDRVGAMLSRDRRKDTTLDYLDRGEKGQPMQEGLRAAASEIWQTIKGAFRYGHAPTPPPAVEPAFKRESTRPEVRVAQPKVEPAFARDVVRPTQRPEVERTRPPPVAPQHATERVNALDELRNQNRARQNERDDLQRGR